MKGLIFTAESIRANLDGKKTQTRRVIKKPDEFACLTGDCGHERETQCELWLQSKAPFKPGDIFYAKETWATDRGYDHLKPSEIPDHARIYFTSRHDATRAITSGWDKSRSSMYLPKRFARYFGKILDVSVERVQEISEADAIAEGVDSISMADIPRQATLNRRSDFRQLWNIINPKIPFESNPWVWVYTYERYLP